MSPVQTTIEVRRPRTGSKLAHKPFKRKSVENGLKKKSTTAQRQIKAKKKPWKFKKSELAKLDAHFSEKIRTRDGHCYFPGCTVTEFKDLQNSHYEGRARWETRFDEDNCISLCWYHHFKSKLLGYEYQKQRQELHGFDGQYTLHMKRLLGETRFQALINKPKQSRKDAMMLYTAKLAEISK